jgi:hypothetical protein
MWGIVVRSRQRERAPSTLPVTSGPNSERPEATAITASTTAWPRVRLRRYPEAPATIDAKSASSSAYDVSMITLVSPRLPDGPTRFDAEPIGKAHVHDHDVRLVAPRLRRPPLRCRPRPPRSSLLDARSGPASLHVAPRGHRRAGCVNLSSLSSTGDLRADRYLEA